MVCPNCGSVVEEGGSFCRSCGFNVKNAAQNVNYQQPVYQDPYDHTNEFAADDVAKNKLYASLVYFLGVIGLIVVILLNQTEKSAYLAFHIKQGTRVVVASTICMIIPIIGWLAGLVVFVVSLISGFTTLQGKSKEPALISSFNSLK